MMSTALESTSISAIWSASSALPGWLTSSASISTPSRLHQDGSSACSASMNAATPPFRWALATACSAIVVLPLDSGPNSSMIRPRGSPLPPRARSSERAPVEIPSTSMWRPFAQLHDRPGAERLLDLADRVVQCLLSPPTPPASTSVVPCRLATAIAPSFDRVSVRKNTIVASILGCGQGDATVFFPESGARASWAYAGPSGVSVEANVTTSPTRNVPADQVR